LATITKLNGEAKGHRERAEAAEAKFKPFEGIEDPQSPSGDFMKDYRAFSA